VGIDPTNNCLAGERHVRLATGRNFTDTTPVKGTYKGAEEHILEVTVQFSTTEFTEPQLAGILPVNLVAIEPEVMARNSYVAYMQMQQQQ
jgi:transglutaminase-like putative cysteine protease